MWPRRQRISTSSSPLLAASLRVGGLAGGFGGGRGRGNALPPGAIKPFNTLNGSFDAIVSTSQVGLDEAPTQAEIDTWKDDCKDYNATVAAWKKMQSQDLAAFNGLLSRNNLNPLHVSATALIGPLVHLHNASRAGAVKSVSQEIAEPSRTHCSSAEQHSWRGRSRATLVALSRKKGRRLRLPGDARLPAAAAKVAAAHRWSKVRRYTPRRTRRGTTWE